MMLRATALSLVVVCLATACSPGPMPVSQSPHDPSNPAAVEGVVPSVPLGSAGGARGVEAGDAGVSSGYVCPMHPEVTSSAPGRCSKCGMNLVPKK